MFLLSKRKRAESVLPLGTERSSRRLLHAGIASVRVCMHACLRAHTQGAHSAFSLPLHLVNKMRFYGTKLLYFFDSFSLDAQRKHEDKISACSHLLVMEVLQVLFDRGSTNNNLMPSGLVFVCKNMGSVLSSWPSEGTEQEWKGRSLVFQMISYDLDTQKAKSCLVSSV